MRLKRYFEELKRRNVIKAAIAYLVVAWLMLQVLSILLPLFDAPSWILKTITLLMAICFPIWVLVAWLYEITPEGIKKTKERNDESSISNQTENKLNKLIIMVLGLAVIFLILRPNMFEVNTGNNNLGPAKSTENLSSNLQALDFYFKGEFHHKKETLADLDQAIINYIKAVETDSLFAQAYSKLASAYMRKNLSFDSNLKWEQEAYAAAGKALKIDPTLANPHIIQGQFFWSKSHNFAHEEAIDEFRKAILKDPNAINAFEQLSLVQLHIGLFEEALSNARKSIALDPGNYRARRFMGETLFFKGEYESSLREFKKIPKYFAPQLTRTLLALNYFYLNRKDEAIEVLNENLEQSPNDPLSNSAHAIILASMGLESEAEQKIELALSYSKDLIHVHHIYYQLGVASAIMDKKENAVKWLSKAAETGFPNYPLFHTDPYLKEIKEYSPYQGLLKSLKQQWENFKNLEE
jgi:tetratricopeptide (TPR) repeat protein